ncbi:MAG TPA: zf-HC2 domain-containing protein [Actinomycetota bacterium]|nr:zf-HC2 domain-containing protein [Actinomycetota bacterium]
MSHDEVRGLLAEHLLGTLPAPDDARVRRHLRGCGACRRELAALAEGLSTFARAAHELAPPEGLRDRVLAVLEEEWAEAPRPRGRRPWLAAAVLMAVVAAAGVGVGVRGELRAERYEAAAASYQRLLEALGGEGVRVGTLHPVGGRALRGSFLLYDSKVGQSWALVLVRAPGMEGRALATLWTEDRRRIDLHPLEFSAGGEAATWLVTSWDLRPFDRLSITAPTGELLARGRVWGD